MEKHFSDNITVLDSAESERFKVEILEYKELSGSNDPQIGKDLYYVQKSGMKLRQVKLTLEDGGMITEPGTLHFHKGNISCESNIGGVGGLAKKMLHNKLTNESTFKPRYTGTGEVFLEPGFSHFLIVKLDNGSVIVDKGIFYCCEDTLEVGVASQKNISAGLFGGDWFQTRISGTGICVLESPVPMNEILKCNLNNERLQVDGNFALLRSDSVNFSVERSSKGIAGSMTSGEGRLQTFEGTGIVWLAPTQGVYSVMRNGGVSTLIAPPTQ
ncbi:AIM24 family protein [Methanolobus sp. ZRKC2]|uniref:AIM24 family protein n=1 Tax=Methanolobus sp. ZRKC2 TaxID=3125783 RepID=UPI003244FD26